MRIVAGTFRGRRLAAPRGRDVRPTGDKVREAVFGILGDIAGTSVLDLFAGTGAMGLEALSRDAPHPNAVRLALERRREERHQPPPVATILSEHAQARDVAIQAHQLDTYDQLTAEDHDEEPT